MKKKAFNQSNKMGEDTTYKRNNSTQVFKVREFLRDSKYLLNSKVNRVHQSLDGKIELSEDIVHFSEIAVGNTTSYIKSQFKGENADIKPVYVTKDEFLTGHSIQKEIFRNLEFSDEESATRVG